MMNSFVLTELVGGQELAHEMSTESSVKQGILSICKNPVRAGVFPFPVSSRPVSQLNLVKLIMEASYKPNNSGHYFEAQVSRLRSHLKALSTSICSNELNQMTRD